MPVSDWVTSANKTWFARRSHPLRYYPGQVLLKMMENIPIFLVMLPGRVREKKVDNVLAYAGATIVWAILRLWLYQQGHPFYRPDDCFHIEIPLIQKLIPQIIQLAINFALSIFFFTVFSVVVSRSLMAKEEKCPDDDGCSQWPHQLCHLVRGIVFPGVIVVILFMGFMSLGLPKPEFISWLVQVGVAFMIQMGTRIIKDFSTGLVKAFILTQDPEKLANPFGNLVMCPECHVCPHDAPLHNHFRRHLP